MGLAYDMPCKAIDGMNPETVAEALDEAIERARKGEGPTFLEIRTYRYRGHSMSDAQNYRTKKEVAEKQEEDPITYVKNIILDKKYAEEDLKLDNNKIKETINEAAIFAQESPEPSIDELFKDITIN